MRAWILWVVVAVAAAASAQAEPRGGGPSVAADATVTAARLVLKDGRDVRGTLLAETAEAWCLATDEGEQLIAVKDLAAASRWPVQPNGAARWAVVERTDGGVSSGGLMSQAPWVLATAQGPVTVPTSLVAGGLSGPAVGPRPGGPCATLTAPAPVATAPRGPDGSGTLTLLWPPKHRDCAARAVPEGLQEQLMAGRDELGRELRRCGRAGAGVAAAWLRLRGPELRRADRVGASRFVLQCGEAEDAGVASWLFEDGAAGNDTAEALREVAERAPRFTEAQAASVAGRRVRLEARKWAIAALVGYPREYLEELVKRGGEPAALASVPPHQVAAMQQLLTLANDEREYEDREDSWEFAVHHVGSAMAVGGELAEAWCAGVAGWTTALPDNQQMAVRLGRGAALGMPSCAEALLEEAIAAGKTQGLDEWLDAFRDRKACDARSQAVLRRIQEVGGPLLKGRATQQLKRCGE